MRRTKIVCTIGPATSSAVMVGRLVRAGMDVARLNLSHGSLDEHARLTRLIRKLSQSLGANVAILMDLPGPKYRIGKLQDAIDLKRGDQVVLTSRAVAGGAKLPVNLPDFARGVRVGDTVLIDDGAIQLKVEGINGDDVVCRVGVGGRVTSGRGVVVPGMRSVSPFITDSLRETLRFAIEQKPDYLALSFVSRADDLAAVKAIVRENGADIPVIAKIEQGEAVRNFDSILRASDGIMVARGDLGVDIPLERVPLVQKEVIRKCNRAGKPVITATEMLESMIDSPRPTRAETTDVANAIFDGTDATMLSGETSVGKYPVEAVKMMSKIACEAEHRLPYEQILVERETWLEPMTDEIISYNACHTAHVLGAAAIVAFTQSGSTAARVSKYRPRTPILAITSSDAVSRRLVLRWGVHSFKAGGQASVDELFTTGANLCRDLKLAKPGDSIVITAGIPVGVAGSTNLLKVERIT